MGSIGSSQGDMKVMIPSRKATAYCMNRCTPFRTHLTTANR